MPAIIGGQTILNSPCNFFFVSSVLYITTNMAQKISIAPNLPASYATPKEKGKHPAVILIHEIWGLTPHIMDVADRLAKEGYVCAAPDLFADVEFEDHGVDQTIMAEMHDPAKRDEAQKKMRAHFAPVHSPDFAHGVLKKLGNVFHYLSKDENVNGNIAIMGFCFGGTYSLAFAAKESKLKAAISFYGTAPEPDKIATIMCPMLAFYGEKDERLMEALPVLREEMKKQGKHFESFVYPNVGHEFFNDTNPVTYNAEAAGDAWKKTLVFLEKNVK